ncbi:MAG: hypothetical protein ACXWJB_06135, partial [Limisphaerales bacterium]
AFNVPLALRRAPAEDGTSSVCCEFSDKTATGWTNWMERIGTPSGYKAAVLLPHSSLNVAVPLAPAGQPRKVAVLCIPDLRDSTRTWDKVHLWLLPHLPLHMRRISLSKVWCDRELYSTTNTNATSRVTGQ